MLGLLPIVVFVAVEAIYGTIGGLIAGIAFGIGEIAYELFRFKKVQWITLASNGLVFVLGGISLIEGDGLFFKLQPAILIFAFSGLLIGSSILKRPFMVELMLKQRPDVPAVAIERMSGMNLRLGFAMIAIGALSVHAAFEWTTASWAALKTVGIPVLLVIYLGAEILVMRFGRARKPMK